MSAKLVAWERFVRYVPQGQSQTIRYGDPIIAESEVDRIAEIAGEGPAGRPSTQCDTDWTNRKGSPAFGSARAGQCTYHPLHWAELQNAQYVTSPSLSKVERLTWC
jgi:hypothetical protein